MAPICKKNEFFGLFLIVHLVIKVLLPDHEFSIVHRFEKCKKKNLIFWNAQGGSLS